MYKKGLPEKNDKTHQKGAPRNETSTKYKGGHGEPKENNIVAPQGSSIIALLFIIYLGDVVGDLGELNRRPRLPRRIIQERPHGKNKEIVRGAIKEEGEQHIEIQGGENAQKCHIKHAAQNPTHHDPRTEEEAKSTERSIPNKTSR